VKSRNGSSLLSLLRENAVRFQRFLSLALLVASTSAFAQSAVQASWRGVLRNTGGAPIANAKVSLTASGQKGEARTDSDGRFLVQMLPAGIYHLTVATKGSTVECAQPVSLAAETPDVVLTLSDRGELTYAAVQSSAQAGSGGEQLSSQAVSELPLNKRDFSTLLLLAAGTMTDSN
jgi:hypothetical protein